MIHQKKIVAFGAGKIGRAFIGQLFSRSGYEVVFVDINCRLIDELNRRGNYKVVFKGESGNRELIINQVRGICLRDTARVTGELATAGIASFSVGLQGLHDLMPVVAKGLVARHAVEGDAPLDIILAENMRDADRYIAGKLGPYLPKDYPLEKLVGLVETSIGKMVPNMTSKDLEEDPLQVFAEPYNTLIVAKNGFRNPIPPVENLAPRENIKAWVDRKIFIHNLGHATAAYLGHLKHPGAVYMYELLEDREIEEKTRTTMMQSAKILMALYPGEFTEKQLSRHIDDLIGRFGNKSLGDTVFRVGSDLFRKLGPSDRMVTPVRAAIRLNMDHDLVMNALLAAISFRAKDEQGRYLPADEEFFEEAGKGTAHVLKHVCGLDLPADGDTTA
jgi:mannitol-1-phosphate 5-dehydrogenase